MLSAREVGYGGRKKQTEKRTSYLCRTEWGHTDRRAEEGGLECLDFGKELSLQCEKFNTQIRLKVTISS